MTIYLPGAIFAAGISLYYFYEFHRTKEAKQIERRDSLNERRQQYLQQLIKAKKKVRDTATNQPPEDVPGVPGNEESNSP